MAKSDDLPLETPRAKRSTKNGSPMFFSVSTAHGYEDVPSYCVKPGSSIDDAATSLGLRVLGRREHAPRLAGEVAAEMHEREEGYPYLLVRAKAVGAAS